MIIKFEYWHDESGGIWIRIKSGTFENVIWRPQNLKIDEDGRVSFVTEVFCGPSTTTEIPSSTDERFTRICTSCIHDILADSS